MQSELSPVGKRFVQHVAHGWQQADQPKGETFHVAGVASGLYFAYEQLRNAADYTQQHLLLRAAIERFLRRTIYLPSPQHIALAEDLIVELTHARYVKNDSVPLATITSINDFVEHYTKFYGTLQNKGVDHKKAAEWVYHMLSVSIERMIIAQPLTDAFIDFAYRHFLDSVDRHDFANENQETFEAALYFAVHRALINSDLATVRAYWLSTNAKQANTADFITQCQVVDTLFEHPLTNLLVRLINRYGAPLRAIRQLTISDNTFAAAATNPKQVRARLENTLNKLYDSAHSRLIKSIIRTVMFIFFSKMLVGLAIEIPYDMLVFGYIDMLPLMINLLFPPLYMASVYFSIRRPGHENTEAIMLSAERILYRTDSPLSYRFKPQKRVSLGFNIAYVIAFLVPLGLTVWALAALHFTLMHAIIFFIFFSGVSFFRFRLLQSARELELVDHTQTIFGVIADFLYLPFIRLGHWLSDKYRRLNLATFFLDMAIELPLKTTLRLLRQWVGFVREKREEL